MTTFLIRWWHDCPPPPLRTRDLPKEVFFKEKYRYKWKANVADFFHLQKKEKKRKKKTSTLLCPWRSVFRAGLKLCFFPYKEVTWAELTSYVRVYMERCVDALQSDWVNERHLAGVVDSSWLEAARGSHRAATVTTRSVRLGSHSAGTSRPCWTSSRDGPQGRFPSVRLPSIWPSAAHHKLSLFRCRFRIEIRF